MPTLALGFFGVNSSERTKELCLSHLATGKGKTALNWQLPGLRQPGLGRRTAILQGEALDTSFHSPNVNPGHDLDKRLA